MVGYIVIELIVRFGAGYLTGKMSKKGYLTLLFDAVTFATSFLLLSGFVYKDIWKFLGDTKIYLMIAGLAGFAYSLNSLVPHHLKSAILAKMKIDPVAQSVE